MGTQTSADATGQNLVPVPVPNLAGAEESVARALVAARDQLDARIADERVDPRELAEAYGDTGLLYHAHVAFDAAEASYRNAMVLAPGDFRWPYLLAYLHQQNGRLEQAARNYGIALATRPDYPPTRLRLAQIYVEMGQPERAQPLLETAATEDGLKAAALSTLAQLALSRREYRRAATLLEQALAAAPEASRLHYTLAMAYRGLEDRERALYHLEQRGDHEPEFPDPLIDSLGELSAGPHTLYHYAMNAVRAHRYEAAVQAFRDALVMDPDNATARLSLARALYLAGDRAAAEKTLERILAQSPDDALANFLLGVIHEERGSPETAIVSYRRALAGDPGHMGARYYLANALARGGRYEEAGMHYARILQQAPEILPAWTMAVTALVRTGAADARIRELLEKAGSRYPDNAFFTYYLGLVLAASADDAVRDGDRALFLASTLYQQTAIPEHAELLAIAYGATGKFSEAVPMMENALATAAAFQGYRLLPRMQAELKELRSGRPVRGDWRELAPRVDPPPTDAVAAFRDYPSEAPY